MRKGYITIFFSIVISIFISFFLVMLYGVRENALRLKIEDASDISIRSCFAEYQNEIWEDYDLLFIDAGYGYEADSMINAEEHFTHFMNENFDEKDNLLGGKDLLRLYCMNVETKAVRFATDNNGYAIREQIQKIMEERYGIDIINSIYQTAMEIRDSNLMDYSCEEEISEITEEYEEDCPPIMEEWIKEADNAVFGETEVELLSTLRLVFKDISVISVNSLNQDYFVSQRNLNEGNYIQTTDYDMFEKLFFKEYLRLYSRNYLTKEDTRALAYETEYLVSGYSNDPSNLEKVINKILLIREAANIVTLSSDQEKMDEIDLFCNTVAALFGVPAIGPVLKVLIVTMWSYIESVCDIRILLDGGKVPLVKDASQWKTGMADVFTKNVSKDGYEYGLEYADYLRAFLLLTDDELLIERFMNLVEANVRKKTENDAFRLDNCFDAWTIQAQVNSEYGYDYVKKIGYSY